MKPAAHRMIFPGQMLRRGMWLYVWRVNTPNGERLYVGRTGDSSSPHATAPYTRMGQHLGYSRAANSLRRLLESSGIFPEDCTDYELITFGPIYPEIGLKDGQHRDGQMELHKPFRDKMAGMEKMLQEALSASGYYVLNTVRSNKQFDEDVWVDVLREFSVYFPELKSYRKA